MFFFVSKMEKYNYSWVAIWPLRKSNQPNLVFFNVEENSSHHVKPVLNKSEQEKNNF